MQSLSTQLVTSNHCHHSLIVTSSHCHCSLSDPVIVTTACHILSLSPQHVTSRHCLYCLSFPVIVTITCHIQTLLLLLVTSRYCHYCLPVLVILLLLFAKSTACHIQSYYYWSLLYSAILRSRADSLRSHVILHGWTAFYSAFFEYPPKWCTYSAGMAGATRNCCHLGAFCVHHTTMHHVTSCKDTYVRCMRV